MSEPRTRLTAEDRKAQIIDHATRMIATTGYRGFSMSALAVACGLTRAGVLHHVGSKQELLVEVLRGKERESSREVQLAVVRAGRQDPRAVLDLLMRRNIERPEIVRLFTMLAAESISVDHPAHGYFVERIRRGARQLAPLFVDHTSDPEGMAVEILAFMDGIQLNWLRDPEIDIWARWTAFADRCFGTKGE
ncbi:TetR/AcrR family transcriptional regulator [Streptomyces sp. Li-HN-5-11]|uniref:TetR/AcrR family transcriptional regulator n=1 Tax=Streptomyces sp. Li-HN-5-11 TaxID=3075432 RepID=UPI0028AA4F1C|nr:TetR/AcrR family transcriptional regulator [Streptomyces sp. Li-HN-5-11]WNM31939.1 TetR/AcrR family transcriptional regulator [Streptomyces sp. Li-HN-5-11]